MERRTILPVARYWTIAAGDADMKRLDAWLVRYANQVKLINSKFEPGTAGPWTDPVPTEWVLFETLQPTPREGLLFYVAAPAVQQQADVYTPEKGILERAEESIEHGLKFSLEGAGILLALWVFYELTKR